MQNFLCSFLDLLNYSYVIKSSIENWNTSLFEINCRRVPVIVTKIAEKMKAYGLWETFVTDSFEEYIDNLVVNTDLELDDNDLFQEEFF